MKFSFSFVLRVEGLEHSVFRPEKTLVFGLFATSVSITQIFFQCKKKTEDCLLPKNVNIKFDIFSCFYRFAVLHNT